MFSVFHMCMVYELVKENKQKQREMSIRIIQCRSPPEISEELLNEEKKLHILLEVR